MLLTDFSFTLSADDILRGEGTDPEKARLKRPALVETAEEALRLGLAHVRPAAAIREAKVAELRHERLLFEGGGRLTGPLVTRHLAGAQSVTAVVCTIGPEVEELASKWMEENLLLGLALDGLGNAAVERLAQQVCNHIGEQARAKGLTASTPLSPGSPEWPVETGQPQIFALVDAAEAGIRLTSGGMMVPKKSVSFVVGTGAEMSQADLCEVCSLKGTCRYRHD
jgi:Vitamin B12 dependent methionine synthase, activation domain